MAEGRHSYVAFYPSDWLGGTARMTRMQRSVYFDVCCYNWDKAKECPPSDLALMLGDLDGWEKIVDLLVAAGKLYRTPDGSLGGSKAMAEAKKAFDLWERKSKGGKGGADKTNARRGDGTPVKSADGSPDGTRPGVPPQNQNQNQNHIMGEAHGASSQPKRERKASTLLPEICPNESDRDAAIAFWREKGREDLCARLGDEVEAFRDHHRGKGTRMADWSAAWRTWRGNAPKFNAAPKGGAKPPSTAFEQTDSRGWMERMRIWRERGSWIVKWGPQPDKPGCRCPEDVLKLVSHETRAA